MDVEPEAPGSPDLGMRAKTERGLVQVSEDGFHSVRIVFFELDCVELVLLARLSADEDWTWDKRTRLTNGEATADAAGFLEPLVGEAEDMFVNFDISPVAKLDGEVAVIGVVIPAGSSNVSECSSSQ